MVLETVKQAEDGDGWIVRLYECDNARTDTFLRWNRPVLSVEECNCIEEKKADKEAEPPVVSKREVKNMLESCGVSEEHVVAFEQKYDEDFGAAIDLSAQNIVNERKFEVRTPDVVIQVNPERSDLVETRVIDGFRYILIRADEGVAVNGVNINISEA